MAEPGPIPGPQPQPGVPQPSPGSAPSSPIGPPSGGVPIFSRPPAAYAPPRPIRIITSPRRDPKQLLMIAVPIVILLALGFYIFVLPSILPPSNTITNSTVTSTLAPVGQLFSCGPITSPGAYYVSADLKQTALNGSCLSVAASNVSIVCDGKAIGGSGPYTDVGPFSYGVSIVGEQNVLVSGCTISNFSYGVYAQSASDLRIVNSNLTTNFVSDLYLNNATNLTASNNYIANSSSVYGSVEITNGSAQNLFSNNTMKLNAIYGFNITSAGNKFINNYVADSKFSFICSQQAGFAFTGYAHGNTCYNSSGCGFVTCSGLNIPVNLSKVILGSIVSTCGTITAPGSYSLSQSLDMRIYVNYSPGSISPYSQSCINVKSNGVTLLCGGFDINHAYIGIYANGAQNLTLNGCNVNGSQTGVLLENASTPSIIRSIMSRNNVSVDLINASSVLMSDDNTSGSSYGVVFESSDGAIIRNFTADNNEFGIYINNSNGDTFANGQALNNTSFDVFITQNTSLQNLMTSTQCYLSDAPWSTCQLITKGPTLYFPITACTTIRRGGTYALQNHIIDALPGCMTILANNVVLNCSGFALQAQPFTSGSGVVIEGRSNVSVQDCRIANYNGGVTVGNSTGISVGLLNTTNLANYGVLLDNVTDANISKNLIAHTVGVSIMLDRVNDSVVRYNNLSYNLAPNIALTLENSSRDLVLNNFGDTNFVGMNISGASMNNTISNNTFGGDGSYDYQCSPQDSGLAAENGGINYGTRKLDCDWLAVIPPDSQPLQCAGSQLPALYSLTGDAAYYGGGNDSRCFSMSSIGANSSTLNCNGHTILATNGGTLAVLQNTGQITIENCYLKGFSKIVRSVNSSATVLNLTVLMNGTHGVNASAINFTNSRYDTVEYNNITTPYTGVYYRNVTYGKLFYNNIAAAQAAYELYRTVGVQVSTNSSRQSGIGMLLQNSTDTVFSGGNLLGQIYGLICSGTSQGYINNTDSGGLTCSSESKCHWLSASASTC